jgi:hypothetical protein
MFSIKYVYSHKTNGKKHLETAHSNEYSCSFVSTFEWLNGQFHSFLTARVTVLSNPSGYKFFLSSEFMKRSIPNDTLPSRDVVLVIDSTYHHGKCPC